MQGLNTQFLSGNLPFLFRLAQLHAQRVIKETAGDDRHGLTGLEMAMLILANDNPGISQKRLASCLFATPSVLVASIRKMELSKLLSKKKSEHDRRHYALTVTPAGAALAERLRQHSQAVQRQLTDKLSQAERRELVRLLDLLISDENPA